MTTSELLIEADAREIIKATVGDFMCASDRAHDDHGDAADATIAALAAAGFTITRAASQQEMPERIRMLIELAMYRVKDATASKDDGARPDSFIDDKIAEQMAEIEAVYAKGAQS